MTRMVIGSLYNIFLKRVTPVELHAFALWLLIRRLLVHEKSASANVS